jgi:hypothetical protein
VERSQANETLDGVEPVSRRLRGVVGAVTSRAVLAVSGALSADSLPVESTASTR